MTLSSPPGPRAPAFRGFFVQARMVADDTTRVGTFGVMDTTNSKLSDCPTNTVRHMHTVIKLMGGHVQRIVYCCICMYILLVCFNLDCRVELLTPTGMIKLLSLFGGLHHHKELEESHLGMDNAIVRPL